MRLPFLAWAFNFRNNTVHIVNELVFILDWIDKSLESTHEMEGIPGDALKQSWTLVASAFDDAFTVFRMDFQFL